MKKRVLVPLLSALALNTHADTIYPGSIMGRDLLIHGLGWAGHVGIATALYVEQVATHVIEVLNEGEVIQYNPIRYFFTRSRYWGSRTGLPVSKEAKTQALREANWQRELDCTEYTVSSAFKPSQGYRLRTGTAYCKSSGFFRCDTFLNYIFARVGVNIPYTPPILPTSLFRAFPQGNHDGPYAMRTSIESTSPEKTKAKSKRLNLTALTKMQYEKFIVNIDAMDKSSAGYLLQLAKSPMLPVAKRVAALDKVGVMGEASVIPKLITMYKDTNPGTETPLREQLLKSMFLAYQEAGCLDSTQNDCKKITKDLRAFYISQIEQGPEKTELTIKALTRGALFILTPKEISDYHDKLNVLIDDTEINMTPRLRLTLKRDLLASVPSAEHIYLPEILALLKAEDSTDLEGSFHFYIIMSMVGSEQKAFSNSSLKAIRAYLERVRYKYDVPEHAAKFTDNGNMFSFGQWLEAIALVSTKTLPEAAEYIARFLDEQGSIEKQARFVIGLSNSDYLKKAFEELPTLKHFKKVKEDIYSVSIGYVPPEERGYKLQ